MSVLAPTELATLEETHENYDIFTPRIVISTEDEHPDYDLFTPVTPPTSTIPNIADASYLLADFYTYIPTIITRPDVPFPKPTPDPEQTGHNIASWFQQIVGWDVIAGGNTKAPYIDPAAPITLPPP